MGKVFPFISTLSRPFFKFIINNGTIPIAFCICYMYEMSKFQLKEDLVPGTEVLLFIFSFLLGFISFILLAFLYFFPTNKDVYKYTGEKYTGLEAEPVSSFFHKDADWTKIVNDDKRKYIYFQTLFSLKLSRSIKHYDRLVLEKVFSQNYINSTLFELVTIISFFCIGLFKEVPFLQLPAGMSVAMLLTVILMLFSILTSWLKGWAYPFIILAFLIGNSLSKTTALFRYDTYVYGLEYTSDKIKDYSWETIQKAADDTLTNVRSKGNIQHILYNWKIKNPKRKPKLILMMTSGGGLRSAVWTYDVMNYLDSISNNRFCRQLHMITGASGGMVGAAYYRSLKLEQRLSSDFKWESAKFRSKIASDLLNNVALSASVNDLFLRLPKFTYKGKIYSKDRAYAFEIQLNKNTDGLLGYPFSYFKKYERQALIPIMIFSPTIVNDGRRLLMSSQSLAFLSHASGDMRLTDSYENIDFNTFFNNNEVGDVRLSTALRMNATFPYILPMTSLPTSPEICVMDAGIRDNNGVKTTLEYIYELRDWIKENTSGVVIVQMRDQKKLLRNETVPGISLYGKLTVPFMAMSKNFTKTQDYDAEESMKFAFGDFDFPIDLLTFNLRIVEQTKISLSWHLTENEKKIIKYAIFNEDNQMEFKRFIELIK